MNIKHIFQASAVASALVLAGCGGDINITEGDITNTNTTTNNAPSTPSTPVVDDSAPGVASPFLSSQVSTALGSSVEVRSLSGRISSVGDAAETITLTNDTVWALEGPVIIGDDNENSVTLEIEPGTIIFGRSGADYLVISRAKAQQSTTVFVTYDAELCVPTDSYKWIKLFFSRKPYQSTGQFLYRLLWPSSRELSSPRSQALF